MRLSSASCKNGSTAEWSQTFTFNPFGNITKSGSGAYSASYSTATNQVSGGLSIPPTYDGNGNQTNLTATGESVAWNANNQPVTMNGITATYDALGRMVETGSGSTWKQFVFRPSGDMLAVYSGGLVKGTVPLPGGDVAIYNSSGLSYLRHTDWLGSSRFATTWNHAVYSKTSYAPFGETYNESGTADRSYTGQDQDVITGSGATGVYDYLFRKHDPSAGRWLSPDPAGWAAVDFTNPQSFNRYAYVLNNPLSLTDELGLCPQLYGLFSYSYMTIDGKAVPGSGSWNFDGSFWGDNGIPCEPPPPGCTYRTNSAGTTFTGTVCAETPTVITGGGGSGGGPSCLAGAGPLQVGQSRCAPSFPKGSNLINSNCNDAIPNISGEYNVPGAALGIVAATNSNISPPGGHCVRVVPNYSCYSVPVGDCGVSFCAAYHVSFQQLAPGVYVPKPGASLVQTSTQCNTLKSEP